MKTARWRSVGITNSSSICQGWRERGPWAKPLAREDAQGYQNYRPVSNLSFLSKILEKIVAKLFDHYIDLNNLHSNVRSAYPAWHSTETALLRAYHDIVTVLKMGSSIALIMLDLSAAFDVIDHSILIRRLELLLVYPVQPSIGSSHIFWRETRIIFE